MTYPFDLSVGPAGWEKLASEPVFNPARHLALEAPETVYSLQDLGYLPEQMADAACDFGATSVFRVLSEEGAACLYDVCKQLEAFTTSNQRIARNTRGGVYRSAFLRDLCLSPDVAAFMSGIIGMDLMPHTIPHQLGHLNYAPETVGEDIDKWHVDTLRFDYVMFVTDPTKTAGGAFQYFKGSKQNMAALKAAGKPVPAEQVIAPLMPGPGYAVLQQGNMVVHQAKGLTEPGERITMVNGYVAADPATPDYTRFDQLTLADPADIVTSEYVRHQAFHTERQLSTLRGETAFSSDREAEAQRLETLAALLTKTAADLRDADNAVMEHFGS